MGRMLHALISPTFTDASSLPAREPPGSPLPALPHAYLSMEWHGFSVDSLLFSHFEWLFKPACTCLSRFPSSTEPVGWVGDCFELLLGFTHRCDLVVASPPTPPCFFCSCPFLPLCLKLENSLMREYPSFIAYIRKNGPDFAKGETLWDSGGRWQETRKARGRLRVAKVNHLWSLSLGIHMSHVSSIYFTHKLIFLSHVWFFGFFF